MRFIQSLRLSDVRNHFETGQPCLLLLLSGFCFFSLGCEQADLFLPKTDRQNTGSLQIGHTAPPIEIGTWCHGTPVTQIESGKLYVIEFWATWCGPCLTSMPHLAQLQSKYGEQVTFIGVTDESPTRVNAFLNSKSPSGDPWSDVITYRLGTDDQGKMYQRYMQAANRRGIPTAFLIGRTNKIEWIGHPLDLDDALNQVRFTETSSPGE